MKNQYTCVYKYILIFKGYHESYTLLRTGDKFVCPFSRMDFISERDSLTQYTLTFPTINAATG